MALGQAGGRAGQGLGGRHEGAGRAGGAHLQDGDGAGGRGAAAAVDLPGGHRHHGEAGRVPRPLKRDHAEVGRQPPRVTAAAGKSARPVAAFRYQEERSAATNVHQRRSYRTLAS